MLYITRGVLNVYRQNLPLPGSILVYKNGIVDSRYYGEQRASRVARMMAYDTLSHHAQ